MMNFKISASYFLMLLIKRQFIVKQQLIMNCAFMLLFDIYIKHYTDALSSCVILCNEQHTGSVPDIMVRWCRRDTWWSFQRDFWRRTQFKDVKRTGSVGVTECESCLDFGGVFFFLTLGQHRYKLSSAAYACAYGGPYARTLF